MSASDADSLHSKVAAVTLGFWVMKIAATTLGETAGDLLSMTLNLGYVASSAILLAIFAGLLGMQLSARRDAMLLTEIDFSAMRQASRTSARQPASRLAPVA